MGLETANFIGELVDTNPTDNDPVAQGDDHIRMVKRTLQANVGGEVTFTSLLVNNLVALLLERLTEFPIVTLQGETLTDKAKLGNIDGTDALFIDNEIDGAGVGIRGNNASVQEQFFLGVPADHTYLLEDNKTKLSTDADGIDVRGDLDNDPNIGGDQDVTISLQNASGVRVAEITYSNTVLKDWQLDNRVLDGLVSLRALGGPGQVTLFEGDPNGEVKLTFAGEDAVVTKTAGVDFPGRTYDFGQQTDNSIIMRLINLIGGLRIIVSSASGDPGLNQVDNAGVFEQTWINLVRDAGVGLNFAGAKVFETVVGGVLVTGQATATAAAPVAGNNLTRLDYVQNWANGTTPSQLVQVQNMAMQAGRQAAVGQSMTVVYDVPFTGIPALSFAVESAANNAFASITATSTTGFTAQVGVAGATINWTAYGSLTRGL